MTTFTVTFALKFDRQLLAIKPKEHASKVECTASLNVDSEQPEVMALLRYDAGVLTRKGQADDG